MTLTIRKAKKIRRGLVGADLAIDALADDDIERYEILCGLMTHWGRATKEAFLRAITR